MASLCGVRSTYMLRPQILAKTRNSPNIIAHQNLLIYSSSHLLTKKWVDLPCCYAYHKMWTIPSIIWMYSDWLIDFIIVTLYIQYTFNDFTVQKIYPALQGLICHSKHVTYIHVYNWLHPNDPYKRVMHSNDTYKRVIHSNDTNNQ